MSETRSSHDEGLELLPSTDELLCAGKPKLSAFERSSKGVLDDLKESGKNTAAQWIGELLSLQSYEERRADTWRGIAAAMGYEPKAHASVRPTSSWLLARVDKFRAQAASEYLATRPTASASEGLVEELERVVHENGAILVDYCGPDLSWRPFGIEHWTPLSAFRSTPLEAKDRDEVLEETTGLDPAMCLKCGTHPHAIELCDSCEQKFLAALKTSPSLVEGRQGHG